MFTTLYRLEMSPQQQQQLQQQQQVQQKFSNLPTQAPNPVVPSEEPVQASSGIADLYRQEKPVETPGADELQMGMMKAKNNMLQDVQGNRFTKFEMDRVGSIAENIRAQVENGNLTDSEAQQVLIKALKEDSSNVSRWMRGLGEVPWYDREDAEVIEDYVDKNKQAFEDYNRMQREVDTEKQRLDYVYDKKSPKYQKAMQALGQKTQMMAQLGQTLQQGLFGQEAIEGNLEMNQARGEDVQAI